MGRTVDVQRVLIAVGATALAASLGAGSVLAGEINGTGEKHYYSQGLSECKFSGLNDDPEAAFPEGGRTQSYGQLVRQGLKSTLDEMGVGPSTLCNPTTGLGE